MIIKDKSEENFTLKSLINETGIISLWRSIQNTYHKRRLIIEVACQVDNQRKLYQKSMRNPKQNVGELSYLY